MLNTLSPIHDDIVAQGTNAHVLLTCLHSESVSSSPSEPLFGQRTHLERLWVLPPALMGARMAFVGPAETIVFHSAPLLHPRLAFMTDHIVLGQPLLPATAMCDAMLSALHTVSSTCLMLTDVRFVQPLVLGSSTARLSVAVHMQLGAMDLRVGSSTTVVATAQAASIPTLSSTRHTAALALAPRLAAATTASIDPGRQDGFLISPDTADAMLQLGVVPSGSPIKIPVGVAAVMTAQDTHHHGARAAACNGATCTLEKGVQVHGLRTTARAPILAATQPEKWALYATHMVVSERPEGANAPSILQLYATTPLDSALAALAAAQNHVTVTTSKKQHAFATAAVSGVLSVARSEHMLDDQPAAPARCPVLRPSLLHLPSPYQLEAIAGKSFDALTSTPLKDQTPGPGELLVQVEVCVGALVHAHHHGRGETERYNQRNITGGWPQL